MLLSWMFISSYTTIYFFVKENYFFECLYFNEYDIRMSLSVYCLRNGLSIKYVRNWQEGSGGHTKCYIGYQDALPQMSYS